MFWCIVTFTTPELQHLPPKNSVCQHSTVLFDVLQSCGNELHCVMLDGVLALWYCCLTRNVALNDIPSDNLKMQVQLMPSLSANDIAKTTPNYTAFDFDWQSILGSYTHCQLMQKNDTYWHTILLDHFYYNTNQHHFWNQSVRSRILICHIIVWHWPLKGHFLMLSAITWRCGSDLLRQCYWMPLDTTEC